MTNTFHCPVCGQSYQQEAFSQTTKVQCFACETKFLLTPEGQVTEIVTTPMPALAKKRSTASGLLKAAFGLTIACGIGFLGYGYLPTPAASAPAPKKIYTSFAEHADHYELALVRAKETGKDIVVFQRGSDWNRLAENLYSNIWLHNDFAGELGDRFILVAVDNPETLGGPAAERLAKLTQPDGKLPPNEITALQSQAGAACNQRDDTAWVVSGNNPHHDTLTLTIKPHLGGRTLRLDFLQDPNLPGNGPGRAHNGNFGISEVEVERNGQPLKPTAAWGSATEGNWGAWQAIDGIADNGVNLWNPLAHQNQPRSLLLTFTQPIPAGETITVRLICRSQWGQHVPGCLRACFLPKDDTARDAEAVAEAQSMANKNNKLTWWDKTYCPRIALLDSEGRAVACENKPRSSLTVETMAARIKEFSAVREKRDDLWAKAKNAEGPARAELLRQSLDLLGFANWPGNDNCYKFVHDQIRAADPKDESGAVRWLGFSSDPKGGVPWAEPSWQKAIEGKDLTDADYEEALARVDKELKDPRNRVLDNERIQRIMVAKYLIYRRWPGHEEKRFDVQREIAALDPTTFWGIGATGYVAMHKRSATPMLTYGWAPGQVKAGVNTWDMTDTAYFFDHAGDYKVTVNQTSGKDTIKVRRLELLDGEKVISSTPPNWPPNPDDRSVFATISLTKEAVERKLVLRAVVEAEEGKTDSHGTFSVEPELLPAPPAPPALAVPDYLKIQQELADSLMGKADGGIPDSASILASPQSRNALARHELLRGCNADRVAEVAGRPAGGQFLEVFMADTDWMESFLASGPADFAQSLENLRLLYEYHKNLDKAIPRRLATALALWWGSGNRYRLVDRFGHAVRAWEEGLFHASFDDLNVREMRWAIQPFGTAKDYQFLLDDRQTRRIDYFGAAWAIAYIDPNVYGDSVQGWTYIAPWAHHYGTGTGTWQFSAHRQVGGVCGALSFYGWAVSCAHGIPSTLVGQPGHCAYAIRVGQEWPVAYSVTWPTSVTAPGWDGTGYSTFHRLYEPVEQDRDSFMSATRLAWIARMQLQQSMARARVLPELNYSLYQQGVGKELPDFSKLTPTKTGTVNSVSLAAVQPANPTNFGVVWEGNIELTGSGLLRVSTQSDDGSRVLVDGQPIVSANCSQQEKEISLAPGRHPLRVEFSQGAGPLNLKVGFDGVPELGSWTKTYDLAITRQPTNYGIWLEYIKTLENTKNVPQSVWLHMARQAAQALAVCNEAGWALVMRCLNRALPEMKTEERIAVLLDCNRILRQENWVKPEAYPIDGVLNWQADRIGDPNMAIEYFGKLLGIHHSANANDNWIFNQVLSWGANRFAGNAAVAPQYAKAMESFFKSRGDGLDQSLLANTIATGIRKASEAGDLVSFRQWNQMAKQLLPPLKPQDVHLQDAQAAAAPRYEAFPGELLSKDGLLRISSACGNDRPLSYEQVLSGGFGGWFDTNNEEKPWAHVQLAGDTLLSGIILVNRYEYDVAHQDNQWAVPSKISVSTDGSNWTEVATLTKAEQVFRVDLQGKNLRARHVRIERMPDGDKSKPPGRYHFRNFLVFGQRLY